MKRNEFEMSIEMVGVMFTERLYALRSSFRYARTFDELDIAHGEMIDLKEIAVSTLYKMCAPFVHITPETVELLNVRDKYVREINSICDTLLRLDDARFEQLKAKGLKR